MIWHLLDVSQYLEGYVVSSRSVGSRRQIKGHPQKNSFLQLLKNTVQGTLDNDKFITFEKVQTEVAWTPLSDALERFGLNGKYSEKPFSTPQRSNPDFNTCPQT